MSLIDQAKEGMTKLESAISGLPIISDYREKELRRDADYRLRQTVADQLETYRKTLTGLQRDLVSAGQLRALPDMERAVGRLQLLIDRIRTASYGYAPFYDAQEIREPELDKLIAFDKAISEQTPKIGEDIDALGEAIRSGGDFGGALDTLLASLAALHTQYDQREQVISYLNASLADETALDA